MNDNMQLDGSELLHLAIEASRRDDHGSAIAYLKQALDLPSGSTATSTDYGKLLYMLGAEYAQIGLMDRAQDHMAQALEVNPDLHTARLQLGLLHLTRAQVDQAQSVLLPLADLGEASCLYHFQQGLACLMRDELQPCCEHLQRGMAVNANSPDFNQALNEDMQKLLTALTNEVPSDLPDSTARAEADFLMSAYHKAN
jgi:tetratricopeptide (TPR) repeat protein